jgi:hypothetical protein
VCLHQQWNNSYAERRNIVVKLRAEDYVTLPDGVYSVRVTAVEEMVGRDGSAFIRWTFEVVNDPEYGGTALTAVSSLRLTPKSKTRQFCEALLGRRLERGEEVELDDLVGRTALANVTSVERNGAIYNTVESLAPVRRRADVPF